jgi:hypothetical protein
MHLVNLLLPLYDNQGATTPRDEFDAIRAELTSRFGGLTAYTRAPAEGLWLDGQSPPQRDDLVVFEVIVDSLDPAWWQAYRVELERRFKQARILIRAHEIELL